MCSRETIHELQFTHFVIATAERKIFASARQDDRLRNFVYCINGGWVQQQVNSRFEYLPHELAARLIQQAENFYGKVPTYTTKTLQIG